MRENMIKAVTDGLTLLVHRIEGRAAARLYDLNIVSENFFKDLLNCLRNLALVNLNKTASNYPAIDLGDKTHRVSFQVTADRRTRKIQASIDTFLAHQLIDDYDEIYFLILGNKQKRYAGLNSGRLKFYPSRHILDIFDLIREAATASLDSLTHLASLI